MDKHWKGAANQKCSHKGATLKEKRWRFEQKNDFFDGRSWFKFNNLGLVPSMTLKICSSGSKGLKVKVRKFWGLTPTFREVAGKKLVE